MSSNYEEYRTRMVYGDKKPSLLAYLIVIIASVLISVAGWVLFVAVIVYVLRFMGVL